MMKSLRLALLIALAIATRGGRPAEHHLHFPTITPPGRYIARDVL
jgi:hypothetical protein